MQKILFLLLLSLLQYDVHGLYGIEKALLLDKFHGVCPGYSKLPIEYTDVKIKKTEQGQMYMDLVITVKEDVTKPLKMTISITKCNKDNTSKCQTYREMKVPNYCQTIQADSRNPFHQFFKPIKPEWKCPIKKGTYKAIGSSVDISMMMLMNVEDYIWKMKATVEEQATAKVVLCILGEGHFEVIKD